jgi:hypothetical protein
MLGDHYRRMFVQADEYFKVMAATRLNPKLGSKIEVDVKAMWLFFGDLCAYLRSVPDYDKKADQAVDAMTKAAGNYQAVLARIKNLFDTIDKSDQTDEVKESQAALREILIHFHIDPIHSDFSKPDERERHFHLQISDLESRIEELEDWIKNPATDGTPGRPARNQSRKFQHGSKDPS